MNLLKEKIKRSKVVKTLLNPSVKLKPFQPLEESDIKLKYMVTMFSYETDKDVHDVYYDPYYKIVVCKTNGNLVIERNEIHRFIRSNIDLQGMI